LRYLAFDIETAYPENPRQVISIAASFGFSPNPQETISWQSHDDEEGILSSFVDYFLDSDPDVVFTWRGGGFDIPIIYERMRLLGVKRALGRNGGSVFSHEIYKSAPFSEFETTSYMLGRTHMDLAMWAERNDEVLTLLRGARSSLKRVARALGHDPIEVDTSHMLSYSMEELAEYNESDSYVTYLIGLQALRGLKLALEKT